MSVKEICVFKILVAAAAKSRQSCLTPRDPVDGSPPGSSVPGILQARTLDWVKSWLVANILSISVNVKLIMTFLGTGLCRYKGYLHFYLLKFHAY